MSVRSVLEVRSGSALERMSKYDLLLALLPLPLVVGIGIAAVAPVPTAVGAGVGGLPSALLVGYGLFGLTPDADTVRTERTSTAA